MFHKIYLNLNKKIIIFIFLFINLLNIFFSSHYNLFRIKFSFKKNIISNKHSKNLINNKRDLFFFNFKEGELNYCENFAIFVYNYLKEKPKPKIGNIGDYIQSLAALQFLPKNCFPFFVDRDNIEFYKGPKSFIIMNGWYWIKKGNRKISDRLIPIYLSLHISNKNYLDLITINNFKKYQPIGCRDTYTLKALQKLGIKSYFSSCLTTTLDIDYSVNDSERTNEIIFNDYKFGNNKNIDKFIKSLKAYNFNKVIYTTHNFSISLSHFDRFKLAKNLLNKYARAKLVITTRIHGALPCLSFNTPVIFVNEKFDRRYPGLYELLNTVGINVHGKFYINVKLNNNNLVVNSRKYLIYANRLKEILQKLNKDF